MDLTEIDKEFYAIIMYNYLLNEQYALRVWAEQMEACFIVERINEYGRKEDQSGW